LGGGMATERARSQARNVPAAYNAY
jgi:hypothetical protein